MALGEVGTAAIIVDDVWKRFRRIQLQRNYTTIKSLLLGRSRGPRGEQYRQVLAGVSFEVPRGQTWGVIGPNGAGKSTLLRLLSRIYRPDQGKITVEGRLATMIELGAGFHPDFSGRENVTLNGIVLGLSKKEISRKFDEIVAFSGLEEFIDEPVRTYSSGMYMRLGFSIAVHVEPDVLLLDEVLAVGDEQFSIQCKNKIHEIQRAGKTILLVSHDLTAVESFCTFAIRLNEGRVVDRGHPHEVVGRYRAEVSAQAAQTAGQGL